MLLWYHSHTHLIVSTTELEHRLPVRVERMVLRNVTVVNEDKPLYHLFFLKATKIRVLTLKRLMRSTSLVQTFKKGEKHMKGPKQLNASVKPQFFRGFSFLSSQNKVFLLPKAEVVGLRATFRALDGSNDIWL